jgi:hypothetical protein
MWGVKLDQRRDLVQGLTRAMILAGQNQDKGTDRYRPIAAGQDSLAISPVFMTW